MYNQLRCTRLDSNRYGLAKLSAATAFNGLAQKADDDEGAGDASSTGVFLYASNSTIAETINATEPDTRISAHLPPNWNYLGCNYDTSNVALKNLSWAGDMLSLERCAEYCTHYRYFGVKAGRE